MPLDARSLDYGLFVEDGEQEVVKITTTPPTTPPGWISSRRPTLIEKLPGMQKVLAEVRR